MNKMRGPYFKTELSADITVRPEQMNNNINDHIKRNLESQYLGKCYDNYGYISQIYEVNEDIKGGLIRAEDNTSSSVHRVQFYCRICNPMIQSIITGKIIAISNVMIVAENGPIKFMIGEADINRDNIQFRKSAFYPIVNGQLITNKPLVLGTYVKIRVINKRIVKENCKIIVFGRLESVIPESELNDAIKSEYTVTEDITEKELVNLDNTESDTYTAEEEINNNNNDDDD